MTLITPQDVTIVLGENNDNFNNGKLYIDNFKSVHINGTQTEYEINKTFGDIENKTAVILKRDNFTIDSTAKIVLKSNGFTKQLERHKQIAITVKQLSNFKSSELGYQSKIKDLIDEKEKMK